MKEESLQSNQDEKPKEKRISKLPVPDPNMTQKEIGSELRMNRHEVAWVEAEALRKLKRRLEEKGYDKDSFFQRRKHDLCIRSAIYFVYYLGVLKMNKDIRDLETHIHRLWSVKEQVSILMWRYLDHPEQMTEDEMANQLMAVEHTLDLYCEKLFDEYKKVCQIDEYAPYEVKMEREKLLKKLYKKKKDLDIDGRC